MLRCMVGATAAMLLAAGWARASDPADRPIIIHADTIVLGDSSRVIGNQPVEGNEIRFATAEEEPAKRLPTREDQQVQARLARLESMARGGGSRQNSCCNDSCCNDACYGSCCNSDYFDDSCCNSCCDCQRDACYCGHACGWYAGAGVYYIKPHWTKNPAYRLEGNPTGSNTTNSVDFDWDYEVAPLAWIGYVGDTGFGIRGRWFEFDHSSDLRVTAPPFTPGPNGPGFLLQSSVFTGGPGSGRVQINPNITADFHSNLELDVYDLEFTQAIHHGCWTWVGSAGVRYLHIVQRFNVFAPGNQSTAGIGGAFFNNFSSFSSGHNFTGAGPTVSLEGRRAVPCTGLSLYGNVRGSVVFGDSLYDATETSTLVTLAVPASLSRQVLERSWTPVGIIELELGADYRHAVGSSIFFARAGLVGQLWTSVGNASGSDTAMTGAPGPGYGAVEYSAMGLYGLRSEIGINY